MEGGLSWPSASHQLPVRSFLQKSLVYTNLTDFVWFSPAEYWIHL